MKKIIVTISMLMPWVLKRLFLQLLCGYKLHKTAHIGFAYVSAENVVMGPGASIGHFSVCKGLSTLHIGEFALIGKANWISAHPSGGARYYEDDIERRPDLVMGPHSAITHLHLLDCTAAITIGRFTTLAGYNSQLLSHSINIEKSRQEALPITIGDYCFIGTQTVILGGSRLPSFSLLTAKSLLRTQFTDSYWIYGGVPAEPIKPANVNGRYFLRTEGVVT